MRLLIVSHTPHYRRGDEVVGWGPTVREIDQLAPLAEEVVHLAPLHRGAAPASALPYASPHVRLRPLRPAGGDRWRDKLAILAAAPGYLATLLGELRRADAVHLRAPANVVALALPLLMLLRRPGPRWIKYAGEWRRAAGEPWSYTLQRRWLRRGGHGAVVTVNGEWTDEPAHVRPFLNPCLTEDELAAARSAALGKRLEGPARLLFCGLLAPAKGPLVAVEALASLRRAGRSATLDLVGDGPERQALEALVRRSGLDREVTFHGWLPRPALAGLYDRAHLLLLPSRTEGWPKVVSEAMAHGVVPLTSAVSSLPAQLAAWGTGRALPAEGPAAFAAAVADYLDDPERWRLESRRAGAAAAAFTYERYVAAVRALLVELGARPDG